MAGISEILSGSAEFINITDNIKMGKCPVHITGMTGSQKSHFIYSLVTALNKNFIVVTYDEAEAGRISNDLSFLFCRETPVFKNKDYVFYNVDASSHTSEISRLRTLSSFRNGSGVIATIESVSKFTVPPEVFDKSVIEISMSSIIDIKEFSSRLISLGYQKTSTVEGRGQFSVRGSIVDVFSSSMQNPVRIDLFDDEIDSLREFDPSTQLSLDNISSFTIAPVREIIYSPEKAREVAQVLKRLKNENFIGDAEKLEQNAHFQSLDKYLPYFYDRVYTLLDYADGNTLVFIDEEQLPL